MSALKSGMAGEKPGGEIVVYETPEGGIRVDVRLDRETVWLYAAADGRTLRVFAGQYQSAFKEHL